MSNTEVNQDVHGTPAGIPSKRLFGPPLLPKTPSERINVMLEKKCGKPQENPIKAAISFYICGAFQVIGMLYDLLRPSMTRDSRLLWIVACTIVSVGIFLKAYILYYIAVAFAYLLHLIIFYSMVGLALGGVALGITGVVLYGKKTTPATPATPAMTQPEKERHY